MGSALSTVTSLKYFIPDSRWRSRAVSEAAHRKDGFITTVPYVFSYQEKSGFTTPVTGHRHLCRHEPDFQFQPYRISLPERFEFPISAGRETRSPACNQHHTGNGPQCLDLTSQAAIRQFRDIPLFLKKSEKSAWITIYIAKVHVFLPTGCRSVSCTFFYTKIAVFV